MEHNGSDGSRLVLSKGGQSLFRGRLRFSPRLGKRKSGKVDEVSLTVTSGRVTVPKDAVKEDKKAYQT